MSIEKKGILRFVTFILVWISFIIITACVTHDKWIKLNNHLKFSCEQQFIPVNQLSEIKSVYLKDIVKISKSFSKNQLSCESYLKQINSAIERINQGWGSYKQIEKSDKFQDLILKADRMISKLNQALKVQDCKNLAENPTQVAILSNTNLNSITSLMIQLNQLQLTYLDELNVAHLQNQAKIRSVELDFEITVGILIGVSILLSLLIFRDMYSLIGIINKSKRDATFSDLRFRSFIQNAGEPISIIDNNLKFIEVNKAFEKLLGYSRDELIGNASEDIVVDYDESLKDKHIEQIRLRENGVVERKFKRKDNSVIHVEVNATELPGEGFISIIRDVSERKIAEKALQASDDKYRYLFHNSPAYIIIWDLETFKIKEVNQAVIDRYGYSKEEWKVMDVFQYRPKEDHEKMKDFARDMLSRDQIIVKGTWKHLTKQGDEILMEINSHKIIYEGSPAILSLANDVTEQRKAALVLEEKEKQLKLFIDLSPAALAMLDTNMCYLETSKRWISDYGLFGQQIIGKSHYEIFPEIPNRWKEIHKRALTGQIEMSDEDYFIRKDGKKEWIKWQIYPWYKATGEIGGIVMMTEVLTESKNAQEMFQYQFENSPDIILIVNRLNRIEKINRSVEGGISESELIGRDCIDVLPEETKPMAIEALKKCFETGENTEFEHLLREGTYVRSRFAPIISEEQVTHVMIFATDITEVRKKTLELQQNEYKLRMLTEQISDAILLLNERAEIVYTTSVVTKVTGFESNELLHKHVTHFIVPEDLHLGEKIISESLGQPGVSLDFEFRIRDVHGNIISIKGHAVNQLNDSNVNAFIVNFRVV